MGMFQSLFFWMMPIGEETQTKINDLEKVSILVLLDDAYRPATVVWALHFLKMFQSLFFWMMPIGLTLHSWYGSETGFNPCSSGWCLSASIARTKTRRENEVSILVLLDDAYRLRVGFSLPHLGAVSILVLLDDAYRPWLYPPCLCLQKVSILVLLDDAYRQQPSLNLLIR